MIKKVTWKHWDVKTWDLSHFLTQHNFQPGQFVIVESPMPYSGEPMVRVVGVSNESNM